jgi:hypothetical protein
MESKVDFEFIYIPVVLLLDAGCVGCWFTHVHGYIRYVTYVWYLNYPQGCITDILVFRC